MEIEEQEVEQEEPIEETPEGEDETGEAPKESEEAEEVLTVTIGEEEPPEEAPVWVKDLRRRNRELAKKVKQYEDQLTTAKAEPVGEKPNLEKLDYDTAKYEQELTAWYDRKRRAEEREAEAKRQQDEQQKAWNDRLTHYEESKTALKVKDYDEAEDTAKELFNVTQQGIIVQGSDNPALVVYALGKNPSKAKELAAISDPVKFSFAVAKLEAQVKMNKKTPPKPESRVTGTGRVSGAVDSTLERLRDDAAKTGDFTKVHEYKQKKRAQK